MAGIQVTTQPPAELDDEQLLRYSRHILLDEIGIDGQQKLISARVLILGLGGLGCSAAQFLGAAGIGTLVLADDDQVDASNLQRQVLHIRDRIGLPKVDSARTALIERNAESQILTIGERLCDEALIGEVARADVVVDCTDNFPSRQEINRTCVRQGKPLVMGAAIRFSGQIAVFDHRMLNSPCYECLFPDGEDPQSERCATTGVFGPLVGIIGCMQAAETIKLLTGIGQPLEGRLLRLDALQMSWRESTLQKDPGCPICGNPMSAPVPP
jgi:molybdopterin-synthase adenylyltransferase